MDPIEVVDMPLSAHLHQVELLKVGNSPKVVATVVFELMTIHLLQYLPTFQPPIGAFMTGMSKRLPIRLVLVV